MRLLSPKPGIDLTQCSCLRSVASLLTLFCPKSHCFIAKPRPNDSHHCISILTKSDSCAGKSQHICSSHPSLSTVAPLCLLYRYWPNPILVSAMCSTYPSLPTLLHRQSHCFVSRPWHKDTAMVSDLIRFLSNLPNVKTIMKRMFNNWIN